LGLSPAQFDVIAQVGSRDGLTQSELADRLFVTQGNITQLLDKMQRLGLVVRRTEGRSKRLALTERGRMLYREVVPRHEESVARKFSALSETELRMLARVMRKLNREEGG
jgi:DNA-binding MarR family transcriptional regulator